MAQTATAIAHEIATKPQALSAVLNCCTHYKGVSLQYTMSICDRGQDQFSILTVDFRRKFVLGTPKNFKRTVDHRPGSVYFRYIFVHY